MKLPFRPVIVLSAPRSGSTLFRLVWNAHPNLAFPPPAWLYELIRPFVYSYGDLSKPENLRAMAEDIADAPTIKKGFDMDADTIVSEAKEASFAGLFEAVHRVWAARDGKTRWGQKSPRNAFWIREILEDFPETQFVHIVRDGRDVTLDLTDTPNFRPDNIYCGAQLWARYVGNIRRSVVALGLGDDQYMQVKYEEFCADPAANCRKVCDFLGEDYSDAMLSHHTAKDTKSWSGDQTHAKTARPISTDYCEMWRTRLTPEDLTMVSELQQEELAHFGYEVPGGSVDIDPLDAAQWWENEIPTSVPNLTYKNELQIRRQARADAGVYDHTARKSRVWGTY